MAATKRNIGSEILAGIEDMRFRREGKLTLRTHKERQGLPTRFASM